MLKETFLREVLLSIEGSIEDRQENKRDMWRYTGGYGLALG